MNDEGREDWFGEGAPGEPPTTDEFGRTDPDSLERERRRQERMAKRASRRQAGAESRRRKRKKEPSNEEAPRRRRRREEPVDEPTAIREPEAAPPPPPASDEPSAPSEAPPAEPPASPPTAERATPRRRAPRAEAEGDPGPSAAERGAAAAGSAVSAMRERIERARAGREGGGGRGFGRGGGGSMRPPNFGRRRVAAAAAGVAALLFVWFLVAFFQPFAGEGEGEVVVQIPEGASATQVSEVLTDAGVVSNGTLFKWRLQLSGKSEEILPGRHVLAADMSYGAAIDRLTTEQKDGLVTVTTLEGLPRSQIAPIVTEAGLQGDYVGATESFKGFNPGTYGAKNPPHLEGFLFPATYELEPNSSVNELIAQQLEAFEQNFAQVNLKFARSKNLTPYDVLTIASMVDREVQVPKERRLVASVIYNRLSQGIPLGIDATTRYEYDVYDEQLTNSQLQADTPYNTRLNQGLPPTPIGNPGLEAIKAAANPAKTKFLYFVVKPYTCGEHSFTASEQEFEQLVADYQAALEKEGGAPTTCPDGAE